MQNKQQQKEALQAELAHIYSLIKLGAKPAKFAHTITRLKSEIAATARAKQTALVNDTNTFKTDVERLVHSHKVIRALTVRKQFFILRSALLFPIVVNPSNNTFEYYTKNSRLMRGTYSVIATEIHLMYPPHNETDFWEVFTISAEEVKIDKLK